MKYNKRHDMQNNDNNDNDNSNVYLSHIVKDEWNDVQAYYIESVAAWRNIALFTILLLTIVSIIALYIINQDKHKILVFERNNSGSLSALGIATKTLKIDNLLIAHQLVNFVMAIREVPYDVNMKRRNIDIVHKMSDNKLKEYFNKMFIDRYLKLKNSEVAVEIYSIKPLGNSMSWEIRWHETINYDHQINTTNVFTKNWSAVITFKIMELNDIATQIVNPIGLDIVYFNPVEDVD